MAAPLRNGVRAAVTSLFAWAVLAAGWWRPAESAEPAPRDSLLHLVGADVVFCLEANDLAQHWSRFRQSELVRRLAATTLFETWRQGEDYRRLERIQQEVSRQTGLPFHQFASSIFGTAAVWALYSDAEDGRLHGVLVSRAVDGESLERVLDAWNRQPGVVVRSIARGERHYLRRERSGRPPHAGEVAFYYADGALLALSDREGLIRKTLDLAVAAERGRTGASTADIAQPQTLAQTAAYRRWRQTLSPQAIVTAFCNPRALDRGLSQLAHDRPRTQVLAEAWTHLDALGCALRIDDGLVIETDAYIRRADLPARWAQFLEPAEEPARFIDRVPAEALVAVAGRHDLAAFARLVSPHLSERGGRQWELFLEVCRGLLLGRDPIDDVLAEFPPDWGLYFVPRAKQQPGTWPVGALLAFELPPEKPAAEGRPTLKAALQNALLTAAHLLAALHNSQASNAPARVSNRALALSDERGSVPPDDNAARPHRPNLAGPPLPPTGTLYWVDGIPGVRPAYALLPEHLALATDPDLLADFAAVNARQRLASEPDFSAWRQAHFARAGQLVFVNARQVRNLLTGLHDQWITELSQREGIPAQEAENRFRRLHELLGVVDAAFLTARVEGDRVQCSFGVLTAVAPSADATTGSNP